MYPTGMYVLALASSLPEDRRTSQQGFSFTERSGLGSRQTETRDKLGNSRGKSQNLNFITTKTFIALYLLLYQWFTR